MNLTIAGLLHDESEPLSRALENVGGDVLGELRSAVEPVENGEAPETLPTSGYDVIHTLQTALTDALTAESADEAMVTAVNRGGDTDTVGAVAGAVAGARFGASDLPERCLSVIDERNELTRLTDLRNL